MSDSTRQQSPASISESAGDSASDLDRRRNARLRELVDEMLGSIRESQRRDDWTADERARAEADLERIMAQVRRAAVRPPAESK